MGRAKPFELATRSFEKQGDATAFFREMLNRYRPGDRVSEEDGLDVAALLERHTEYVAKVGCGVDHFEVVMTEHGTQCFRIVRVNGTGTDFSYPHCISQRAPSRKQEVSAAFRQRNRARGPYCFVSCLPTVLLASICPPTLTASRTAPAR